MQYAVYEYYCGGRRAIMGLREGYKTRGGLMGHCDAAVGYKVLKDAFGIIGG